MEFRVGVGVKSGMKVGKIFSSLAPYLAAAAFVFLVLAFYVSIGVYRLSVYMDAKRELETRAELAAMTLAEPLRTQDFAAVRAFGDVCRERGYELSVRASGGGRIFDTRRNPVDSTEHWLSAEASSGEYVVWLVRSRKEVFAPFRRTYRLFVLAALAGAAGVFVFFFALYRQRVRIRELARMEKFRREFVSDVSHEIKTPLTGILGAAEMLSESGASESQRPLLSMISKESTRLNALVQQILDLARLEREGETLDLAETDLVDLARESVDLMRPRAEAVGIALSFVAPEAPCIAKVDARLIGEAVGNLVSNAIRHSGSPDVAVSVSRTAGLRHCGRRPRHWHTARTCGTGVRALPPRRSCTCSGIRRRRARTCHSPPHSASPRRRCRSFACRSVWMQVLAFRRKSAMSCLTAR